MTTTREKNLAELGAEVFDVLVIGGGINGAVSAAALAARGAKVALVDRGDFAGFTSQESSNLAWGGIKYMESYELGLVRKLCKSRNHLIRSYPSTVQEIRFYAVHERGFRHALWKLVLGTWLYWLIGSFFTRPPRRLSRATMAREEPVLDLAKADGGIEYSDAYLHDNDARFVWNFVRRALDAGAIAANYVESAGARREDGLWVAACRDVPTGRAITVRARALVNACGPFVDAHNALTGQTTHTHHAFSKGIHLIVPKLTESRRVLTFFADDGRLFFVIPMGTRTCIGTTDTKVGSPDAHVTVEDREFVLSNINKRLALPKPLTEADIIAERCGVRPLAVHDTGSGETDWLNLSRKHVLEVNEGDKHLCIFGGKLTDCLNVGEEVCAHVERLGIALPDRGRLWYGEPGPEVRARFYAEAAGMNLDAMTSPRSSELLTSRLWRRYGEEAFGLVAAIRQDPRKGEVLIENAEYLRCEIELAARREMIVELDDFLRRRSKIALVLGFDDIVAAPGLREACRILFGEAADAKLATYVRTHGPAAASPARATRSEHAAAQG
jgi:glycerol-3-phosphate dehydrogenase